MGIRALTRPWLGAEVAASYPTAANPPATQLESPWADTSALDSVTLAGLFDSLDALPVTRSQAIAIPSVARGRDLICISVARLALYAMNGQGRLADQPRIVSQPERGRSRFLTFLWTVDSLLFNGLAVWEITDRYETTPNRPRRARFVPPSSVQLDSSGIVRSVFGRKVDPDRDVLRFDGPHEGFLTRGADTVRNARNLAYAYAQAARTPTPDVELHQVDGEPMADAEITAMIAQWAAARRGENGRVAYTNKSIQAIMHGQQPEQLLISARKDVRMDVAHHLGLPAWAVDAPVEGSSLTYSNVPSRSRELIDYTLSGYMEALASRLSLDDVLAAGTWAAFTTDVLTNGDFGDRMTAGKVAVDAGIYSAAEIRAMEAGIPVEGTPA